jgi:hypothetical protein
VREYARARLAASDERAGAAAARGHFVALTKGGGTGEDGDGMLAWFITEQDELRAVERMSPRAGLAAPLAIRMFDHWCGHTRGVPWCQRLLEAELAESVTRAGNAALRSADFSIGRRSKQVEIASFLRRWRTGKSATNDASWCSWFINVCWASSMPRIYRRTYAEA